MTSAIRHLHNPIWASTLMLCAGLFTSCSPNGSTPASASVSTAAAAQPASTSQPPKTLGDVVKAGVGQKGNYAWVSAVVHNNTGVVGQTVTVNFNVLDEQGAILASQAQVAPFSQPNADHIIGTQVEIPDGSTAKSVDATVDVEAQGAFTDQAFAMKTSTPKFTKDAGGQQVTFELSNSTSEPIKSPSVQVACVTSTGQVSGGGIAYPSLVPSQGKVLVSVPVLVSGSAAECSVFVGPPIDFEGTDTSASPDPVGAPASQTADQAFRVWLDQFNSKDWTGQYASLVNAQRDKIAEQEFRECRPAEGPKVEYVKTLAVVDAGVTPIPGTSESIQATKVTVQIETEGAKGPLDVHLAIQDGVWKWMLTEEGFKGCVN